jgi:hypothetical protein
MDTSNVDDLTKKNITKHGYLQGATNLYMMWL